MAIKEIITDIAKLRVPCESIRDPELTDTVVTDLIDTAKFWDMQAIGCAGLAANQIGYPWRVIVIKYENHFIPLVNPEITRKWGGLDRRREGCLSRPGIHPRVVRHKKLRLKYWECPTEDLYEQKFTHWYARVIQHEIDHLNGRYIS